MSGSRTVTRLSIVGWALAATPVLASCGAAEGEAPLGVESRSQRLEDLGTCGPTNVALNPAETGFPHPLESDLGAGGSASSPGLLWDMLDGAAEYPDESSGPRADPYGSHQLSVDFGRPVTLGELTVSHHSDNGIAGHNIPRDVWLEYHDGAAWQPLTGFSRSYDLAHSQPATGFGSYPDVYSFPATSVSKLRWAYDGDAPNVLAAENTLVDVAAGQNFTVAVRTSGKVVWWGLGPAPLTEGPAMLPSATPVVLEGIEDAVAVSASANNACALRETGEVACWGAGWVGQLGNGVVYDVLPFGTLEPVPVSDLTDAVSISVGDEFSCAVKATGRIACWGSGDGGQLGNGSTADASTPVLVTGIANAVKVSAGGSHACAVRTGGTVACWGDGYLGVAGGSSSSTPVSVPGLSDVVDVSVGRAHTCVVHATGAASCWGYGSNGDGTFDTSETPVSVVGIDDAVSVSASSQYYGGGPNCLLRETGQIACWGPGRNGQLGNGSMANATVPVSVSGLDGVVAISAGYSHVCARRASGEVLCWGAADELQFSGPLVLPESSAPVRTSDIDDAESIDAGGAQNCALRAGGEVACWGYGGDGALGSGSLEHALVPEDVASLGVSTAVATGSRHTCALLATGEIACWGDGSNGQLGDGTSTSSLTPSLVPGLGDAVQVVADGGHTCALRATGGVSCWGSGQTGLSPWRVDSAPSPVAVPGLVDTVFIAAGGIHNCALDGAGALACWGAGLNGQLGNGAGTNSATPVAVSGIGGAVAVALGGGHSCAVLSTGELACWGYGLYGQLGNGGLGDAMTPSIVPGLTGVVGVAGGDYHTCALTGAGEVACWGYNGFGQLGNASAGEQSNVPVPVAGLSGVIAIAGGFHSTCALQSTGRVFCWGMNREGQFGNGTAGYSNVPVPFPNPDEGYQPWIFEVAVSGCVEPPVPESASQTLAAGATLTTDSEGDGATPADPVETSVTSPSGGAVSIDEGPFEGGPPDGATAFDQQVAISAPSASVANPLILVFTIDASILPAGAGPSDVAIFRNGVLVGDCSLPAPPRAVSNPCVFSRESSSDDAVITVATSQASVWSFGIRDAEPSDADGDGVADGADRCPATRAGAVVDARGCSIADSCPCAGPARGARRWRHHRDYVACVASAAAELYRASRISRADRREILRDAERSSCGRRPRPPRWQR